MSTQKKASRGKVRTVSYSALNITLHPHPTKHTYVDFLYFIQEEINKFITLKRNTCIYLYNLKAINAENELDGITGTFIKCTDISVNEWFDFENQAIADESDVDSNVKIPTSYKPNAKFFDFVFYPKKHLLVFEFSDKHGSLSISSLKEYFEIIFKRQDFIEKFQQGFVSSITDDDKIKTILNSKKLLKLDIVLIKPNPDDLGSITARILGNLEENNAKRMEVITTADDNQFLKPNQQLQELSKVAANNGVVKATIENEYGKSVPISTASIPKIKKEIYYTNEISQPNFLLRVARKFFDEFKL